MLVIRNAVLTDANGVQSGELLVENGKIAAIGEGLTVPEGCEVLDAQGKILLPAFIDLHAHFRTPGFEYKENVESGSRAAARGGYTFVNCMANTRPVCSNSAQAQSVIDEAKKLGLCEVNQCVSITKDFDGETTGHLRALAKNLRVISDDGRGVRSSKVMYEAMKIAAARGLLVMSHAEDMDLSQEDYRLAENLETARNLYLAMATGARLHMSHVSTKEAMQDIIAARARGVRVTCEVAPHHIWFYDTDYRVNPPIRSREDTEFLIACMKRGEVDAIATDHAPHTQQEKEQGAPGMVGLETAFSVCHTKLCCENGLPVSALSAMMSHGPARLLGLNKGLLEAGADADLVLVDLQRKYTVNTDEFAGKSRNTPFHGIELTGVVCRTIKGGQTTYCEA